MNPIGQMQPYDAQRAVRIVTWSGLALNLLLTGLKFVVGLIGHSQAVVADAVHTLSDMVTDVAVLLGLTFWSAPADASHPYGHSRIETLVTVFIGGALAAVGIGIGYHAIMTVPAHHIAPSWIAATGAALSIVVKEALYQWTVAVGRRVKSPAVVANAWHHRSDALSSIPALLAVIVACLDPRLGFVDHIGAVIVALFILKVSWDILGPALNELMDRGASNADVAAIAALARSVAGVCAVHKIRTRRVGGGLFVDLHVLVDGARTVRSGHAIAGAVKALLLKDGPEVLDVVIHIEPDESTP